MSKQQPNASTIIEVANSLMASCNKLEIVSQARALGWKGDHARAPMLQLALYVATKLAAGEHGQHGKADMVPDNKNADAGDDSDNVPDSRQADSKQGEQQEQQQADDDNSFDDDGKDGFKPKHGEQGEQQEQQEQPQADDEQQEQPQDDGEQQEQPQADGEPDEPETPSAQSDEFSKLLKASGIVAQHRLLEKVWRLSVKANQNVLLIGAAGSGKTMLSEQLAVLLALPFSSISCTMGMSESQLTGWLLPVGDSGKFDYVPSPFVQSMQMPSVFLIDELDAADPNVLMLMNSITSNGFITIPHKLEKPTIRRHAGSIIIAGANTSGSGADDMYSARAALDAATIDRFYPVAVDYDEAYEHGLFELGAKKSRKRAARWMPADVAFTQEHADMLRDWFFSLRKSVRKARLSKVVSSRFAQKLMLAAQAGLSADEIKADLLLGWSTDERARCGVAV